MNYFFVLGHIIAKEYPLAIRIKTKQENRVMHLAYYSLSVFLIHPESNPKLFFPHVSLEFRFYSSW